MLSPVTFHAQHHCRRPDNCLIHTLAILLDFLISEKAMRLRNKSSSQPQLFGDNYSLVRYRILRLCDLEPPRLAGVFCWVVIIIETHIFLFEEAVSIHTKFLVLRTFEHDEKPPNCDMQTPSAVALHAPANRPMTARPNYIAHASQLRDGILVVFLMHARGGAGPSYHISPPTLSEVQFALRSQCWFLARTRLSRRG